MKILYTLHCKTIRYKIKEYNIVISYNSFCFGAFNAIVKAS